MEIMLAVCFESQDEYNELTIGMVKVNPVKLSSLQESIRELGLTSGTLPVETILYGNFLTDELREAVSEAGWDTNYARVYEVPPGKLFTGYAVIYASGSILFSYYDGRGRARDTQSCEISTLLKEVGA